MVEDSLVASTTAKDEFDPAQLVRVPPDVSFDDVAGLNRQKKRVREALVQPHEQGLLDEIGRSRVLIHGPMGVGKTRFVRATLGELGVAYLSLEPYLFPIDRPEQCVARLRTAWDHALSHGYALYLPHVDAIAPKVGWESTPDTWRSMRVIAGFKSQFDQFARADEHVPVIAETARYDDLDVLFDRAPTFDLPIAIEEPDQERREALLNCHLARLGNRTAVTIQLEQLDWAELGRRTEQLSVQGIIEVVRRASQRAIAFEGQSVPDDEYRTERGVVDQALLCDVIEEIYDTETTFEVDDFTFDDDSIFDGESDDGFDLFGDSTDDAGSVVGQDTDPPDVTYDDIGGLEAQKRRLRELVEWPRRYPEQLDQFDVEAGGGVLLYGPPGNGKTLLAKAIANETESSFISIAAPEIMHKYYGESQKFVRKLFDRARELSPSVLFIDEIDGVVAERIDYDPDDVARARVINQFLVELDGFESLEDVVVIGATNRIEIVDSALRRSGRFGHELEVPPPDEAERAEIFRVHLSDRPTADSVTVDWLVSQTTDEYSGADIAKLCEWAARSAMRRTVSSNASPAELSRVDFRHAFDEIIPAGEEPDEAGSAGYH